MATFLLGTNANNSLTSFIVGINDVIPADVASLNNGLRDDPPAWGSGAPFPTTLSTGLVSPTARGTVRNRINQAYIQTGMLVIPNRGMLQLMSGDVIAWDTTTGWPIVVSGDAAANGPYTYTHP